MLKSEFIMKKNDLYEVTIKIIGIVAAYKFVELLITYFTVLVVTTNVMFNMAGIFQANFNILSVFTFVFLGLFAYILLFKTDKVSSLLRLTDSSEVTLEIEKKTMYHVVALMIGFFMLTYSGTQLISTTFSEAEVTNTIQTAHQPAFSNNAIGAHNHALMSTSSTTSTTSPRNSTTVNYINITLFLISILIIFKSEKFSGILMPKEKSTD